MSDEFLIHYARKLLWLRRSRFRGLCRRRLRGAGELRSESAIWTERAPFAQSVEAEAAFSVEEGFRRRGIGEQLFARIVRAASNHGVETIEILCQADNRPMQKLAAKFSTQFRFEAHQITGRLVARRATRFSLLREASQDAADLATAIVDAQMRALFPRNAPEA